MSRRSTTFIWIALALVCVVVIGLGVGASAIIEQSRSESVYQTTVEAVYATNTHVAVALSATQMAQNSGDSDQSVAYKSQDQPQRLVVKDATLRLIVNNPSDALNNIVKMADEMGGWVVNSSTYQASSSSTSATQAQAVIRVPAERLTEAMNRIKAGAVSVQQEDITGSDVTRQYTDLNSQLTNLQAAEEQLRKIMDNAQKTDDVLAVYQQLVKVRGDIEVAKGQMQYYKEAAAFSSITISLFASEQDKPVAIAGWYPLETAKNALSALVTLLQGLVNVLIWLIVVVLPFVILFGLPAWIVVRIIRRRQSGVGDLEKPASTPES